ncbi:MAG: cycloinulo-oligosaccharide fructanotransferase [Planctomycetaceae bacterium]|nr:cycloinulo-oligosaccharide fructanotransferase [Planctomycetaceae bacterium]
MQRRAFSTGLGILAIAGLLLLHDTAAIGAADPPREGLVAHWSLDAIEDGVVSDGPEGGHGAKTIGKPEPVEGVNGGALRFDGRHDYVVGEDANTLDFSKAAFSISAWVNVYGLRGEQQMIVAKNVYSADQREWGLMIDADRRFRFYQRSDGRWKTVESQTTPEPGHWYQVAVTEDSGQACLYVNGRCEGRADLGSALPRTPAPLTIGAVNDGGRVWQTFFGAIDEVRLYRRALEPAEVAGMYFPVTATHPLPADDRFILWQPDRAVPKSAECPFVEGVEYVVVKAREPEVDGYNWLHGAAVCWHGDRLYATFGHNQGHENTATEVARGRMSADGGRTWGPVFGIDDGDTANPAVSHGVLLSHGGELWAFHGAFHDRRQKLHTRAFVLDQASGVWQPRGVVAEGSFWPLQEPLKMDDGNWIMAGICVSDRQDAADNPAAAAISRGDDFTRWDVVRIPKPEGLNMWGESTVVADGPEVLNIARWGTPFALAALSKDFGRTWTETRETNLPMAASKPYAGTLSTGQRYLVGTTTADSGNRRSPLTIAVSRPGAKVFSKIYRIRDAVCEGPGESDLKCRLSYPYAVEHEGKLYVIYSNDGARGGNRNSAELAIVPVASLGAE